MNTLYMANKLHIFVANECPRSSKYKYFIVRLVYKNVKIACLTPYLSSHSARS